MNQKVRILFKFTNLFSIKQFCDRQCKNETKGLPKWWVNYSWRWLENNMIDVTRTYKVISEWVIFSFVFLGDNVQKKKMFMRKHEIEYNIIKYNKWIDFYWVPITFEQAFSAKILKYIWKRVLHGKKLF